MLGLMDMGAAAPFAQIRMHGGSNHLLFPTGLLQEYAHARSLAGAMGSATAVDTDSVAKVPLSRVAYVAGRVVEAALGAEVVQSHFGGGVVRIESCSSEYINSLYPSEITHAFPSRLREALTIVRHVGRQFNPTVRRVISRELRMAMPRWQPSGGLAFVPYTLPALELRRALAEARASNESFTMTYVRLTGIQGDQSWRSHSSGVRVTLTEDGRGARRCVIGEGILFGGAACKLDEVALQPAPRGLLYKLSLFFPLPVLPGVDELACMD